MKIYTRENALNDFLDILASNEAGESIGDTFPGIDLHGEILSGVDFCRSVFDNSVFYECGLSRANLSLTSLQYTDFRKTILLLTHFEGANCLHAKFNDTGNV